MGYCWDTKHEDGVSPATFILIDARPVADFMLACSDAIDVPFRTAAVFSDSTVAMFRQTVFQAMRCRGYDLISWCVQAGAWEQDLADWAVRSGKHDLALFFPNGNRLC